MVWMNRMGMHMHSAQGLDNIEVQVVSANMQQSVIQCDQYKILLHEN